jgi:hypothetical protein
MSVPPGTTDPRALNPARRGEQNVAVFSLFDAVGASPCRSTGVTARAGNGVQHESEEPLRGLSGSRAQWAT